VKQTVKIVHQQQNALDVNEVILFLTQHLASCQLDALTEMEKEVVQLVKMVISYGLMELVNSVVLTKHYVALEQTKQIQFLMHADLVTY
jgi:hypothetical protein